MDHTLAFPLGESEFHGGAWGLTKKEYFAAHTLGALLSNPATLKAISKKGEIQQDLAVKFCRVAIDMADFLMATISAEGSE